VKAVAVCNYFSLWFRVMSGPAARIVTSEGRPRCPTQRAGELLERPLPEVTYATVGRRYIFQNTFLRCAFPISSTDTRSCRRGPADLLSVELSVLTEKEHNVHQGR